MPRVDKVKKTKVVNGYEFIEYLYECPECNYTIWAGSKKLFQTCPNCINKKTPPKVRIAI
tara:strand:+ start:52 stop:231 length:180 start_codon:yes stop_codon:yes gene_type:complete